MWNTMFTLSINIILSSRERPNEFVFEVTNFDDEDYIYIYMYSFVYSETNVPLVVKFYLESQKKKKMKLFDFKKKILVRIHCKQN